MKNKSASEFRITEFYEYKTVIDQYTDNFIKKNKAVKIEETERTITVALAESSNDKVDVLKNVHATKEVCFIKTKDSDFAEFIGNFVDNKLQKTDLKDSSDNFKLEEINSDAPIVNVINAICLEAIRRNASDIHIQGTKDSVVVRFRMDGVLQNARILDKRMLDNLVSRVKVMAGLNVMENRLCQDGRMTVLVENKKLDFRVSIIPSVTGQNIVLRLFNVEKENLSLEQLGFSDDIYRKIKHALNNPHGMILATGPTGSGKTTTLHAMIKEMDCEHLKIVTIEDPVEKIIEGVEQIQVNEEIGLSFEAVLRRILRHDPDVIMVGEIRDKETAELAIRSALTGHLILSTIHTNDSISVVTRLQNLGIEPYLIAGTLRTSIAQRLVRKTCVSCNGDGCKTCNYTGYFGRTVVSEIFEVDEAVSGMIEKGFSDLEMRKAIQKKGFTSLYDDAAFKLKLGITTKSEIFREGLL